MSTLKTLTLAVVTALSRDAGVAMAQGEGGPRSGPQLSDEADSQCEAAALRDESQRPGMILETGGIHQRQPRATHRAEGPTSDDRLKLSVRF